MNSDEFRRHAHDTVDWIADFLRDAGTYRVAPAVKPGETIDRLPKSAPERGEPMELILQEFRELIVPGLTQWNHPRFFGFFSNSSPGPGILGEMLASALNVNHMLWKSGPSSAELEQVTLGWVREWVGLPATFFGLIHDTASTSTMHAILAAKEAAAPQWRKRGEVPPLVLYCSEHAHSSVDRGALAVGLGLTQIRHVPADDAFRMRAAVLAEMIAADRRAGKQPFCVVPTIGTTSTSSVDPLLEVAKIAKENGLWLHVDAAYAGPAAMLPERRTILAGAEVADSLVLNPHKWLFTPMDLSILYLRNRDLMRQSLSLSEVPPYLASAAHDRAVNAAEYTVSLGRRMRALKLWFTLRYYGREGVERILRDHMAFAQRLAEEIGKDARFEISAPVPFSLVCFRYRGTDEQNQALLDELNGSGFAFLSSTQLHGKLVLRLAIGNIATQWSDVEQTWIHLQKMAARWD